MTITLNSLSRRLLSSTLFHHFSESLSYSFVWNIYLCLLILPNSPGFFYVLGRSDIAPGLEGVVLWRKCSVGRSSAVPWSAEPMLKRCPLCRPCAQPPWWLGHDRCRCTIVWDGSLAQQAIKPICGALVCRASPWGGIHFGGPLVLAKASCWVWHGRGHFGESPAGVSFQVNAGAGKATLIR